MAERHFPLTTKGDIFVADASGNLSKLPIGSNSEMLIADSSQSTGIKWSTPNLVERQGNVIGEIYNNDNFTDLSDFTDDTSGATLTVSGGQIHIDGSTYSGGNGSFFNPPSLYLTDWTSLDVMTIEMTFSFPEANSAAQSEYGISLGINGGNNGYSVIGFMYGAFDGNLGGMRINQYQATSATVLVEGLGVTVVPSISVNDVIHYKLELYENTVTWSIRNVTDNTDWYTQTYTYTGTNTKHSSGHVAIMTGYTKADIHSLKVTSKQIKNPDVYLYGDSKFTKSTYQNESIPALLKNHYGRIVANSGVGDTTQKLIDTLPEVIDLVQPVKVLIAVSNDIRQGVSSATWQANIDQLYNDLTAEGIEVYFCSMYETSSSQAAMDTYLTSTYPTRYINRVYDVLSENPDVLLGDNIHLSAFGNQLAADELILDGRLDSTGTGGGTSGYSGYSGRSGYSGYSGVGISGYSGYSGAGSSGFSGYSGAGISGFSGYSGISGYSGYTGFSGYSGRSGYSGYTGFSGYSGAGTSGFSGYSGLSGYSGYSGPSGYSAYSGISGYSGYSGPSGYSGYSAYSGISGYSGYSGAGTSGFSGYSSTSGYSGYSSTSGYSGYSSTSGYSGYSSTSGYSGYSGAAPTGQIILTAAGGWPSTTSGCTAAVLTDSGSNDVNYYALGFGDTAGKLYAEWGFAMPSDYNGGTITAVFYWSASGTSTSSVVWGCQGVSFGDTEALNTAYGTAQEVTDAHTATADLVLISSATAAITLAGTPAASEFCQIRVYRDSANGSDTLAATANLLAVRLTYTRQ